MICHRLCMDAMIRVVEGNSKIKKNQKNIWKEDMEVVRNDNICLS